MHKKNHGGFTLIELALSMVFIAILSVTVVLLIQNVSASYRRGMVLNQLNTVGMDLIDDFRISIQNANSGAIDKLCDSHYPNNETERKNCINDGAASYTLVKPRIALVIVNDKGADEDKFYMPVYGAFCTGTDTYIWNSGYFEQTEYSVREVKTSPAELKGKDDVVMKNFRLIKIYDPERSICENAANKALGSSDNLGKHYKNYLDIYNDNDEIPYEFKIDDSLKDVVELLPQESSDLVIYDLNIEKPAYSSTRKNLFYAASFILGTKRGGANIKATGNSCKPPSDAYSELEYCAINRFNFAVMAGGYGG